MSENAVNKKKAIKNLLDRPENFVNRELSWLNFNLRVLKEAGIKTVPLLERLKFISIAASNLDEFFMVRVAGLWSQYENGINKKDPSGLSVYEQLMKISMYAHNQVKLQYSYFFSLIKELKAQNIHLRQLKTLSENSKDSLYEYFIDRVYPVLTPMAIDASRPFPFIASKSLNIAIELITPDKEDAIAVVQVPSVLPRIIPVDENPTTRTFILLEDLIMTHIAELFSGCKIIALTPFRITRNADLDLQEEEAEDLLVEVQKSLKKRRRGDTVRLELFKTDNLHIKKFLVKSLELEPTDVYELKGPLDLTCFMGFALNIKGFDHLLHPPFIPQIPQDFINVDDYIELLRNRDILLHHPFESFDTVVKLLQNAAEDPGVLAIKQTLYRVSGNSPIVAALARAAENGKQVTVLVELKARFDEENNIIWAKRLEAAGCHVIYGFVGLKTHAKIALIVRQESFGIKRYVHLGTGNYNDTTAKIYTDMGIISSNEELGSDASAFFNMLSGYAEPPIWNKLIVAPRDLRQKVYDLIDTEIAYAAAGEEAHIIVKINSLIDKDVILKLYEASNAGVKIELIVRGICGIRPGLAGVSENITVRSIIGRHLEHTRIICCANGGNEQIFLSSADWMNRNLNERVELMFPVDSPENKERIKKVLNLYLKDNTKSHVLQCNGVYRKLTQKTVDAQEFLYEEIKAIVQENKTVSLESRMQPVSHHGD